MRANVEGSGRWAALVALAVAAALGVWAPAAGAVEHPLLEEFGFVAKPEFVGAAGVAVDQASGDLLVIDGARETLSRYHADGTPADFAALGTNVIDAAAGPRGRPCGEEPSSCDATPEGRFIFGLLGPTRMQVATDSSCALQEPPLSGAACEAFDPAFGNIYVTYSFFAARVIEIFAADGRYLGGLSEYEGLLNEQQEVAFSTSPGWEDDDTFTLGNLPAACSSSTTGPIAFSPNAPTLRSRIVKGLGAQCGGNFNFAVSGNTSDGVTIEFAGFFAEAPLPLISCATVSSSGTCSATQVRAGGVLGLKPFKGLACGVAVDASGAVYTGDQNFGVHKYVPSANPPSVADNAAADNFALPSACTLAAGAGPSAGHLFAAKESGEVVKLDSSSGEIAYVVAPGKNTTVAVDPGDGHVYVARGEEVEELDASGAGAATHEHTISPASTVRGLGLDREGRLYLSRAEAPRLEVYGPAVPTSPSILDAWTASAGQSEATLRARVSPNGLASSFHVEYGTGDSFELATPERELGAGTEPLTVSVALSGLAPGTGYRWRLVASNAAGARQGPERTLATQRPAAGAAQCANAERRSGPAAQLADCRAYEMVSPVDKEGSDIRFGEQSKGIPVGRNQSDRAGGRFTFSAERRFGDGLSQPANPQYIASRGAGGWSTHGISPPRGALRISGAGAITAVDNEFKAFSADLCAAWLVADDTTAPPLAPGAVEGAQNLYRRENCGAGAEGYETLWPGQAGLQGFSADGSLALVRAGGTLHLVGGGAAMAVCLLPDQGLAAFGCSAGEPLGAEGYENNVIGALAADGSVAFFSASGRLYARLNPAMAPSALEFGAARGTGDLEAGSDTVTGLSTDDGEFMPGQTISGAGIPAATTILSASAGELTLSAPAGASAAGVALSATSPCSEPEKACTIAVSESVSPAGARYWAAARDGSAVLFAIGSELYEFDLASRTARSLAPATLGVLGASEDLARIYLVSEALLGGGEENSEGERARAGEPNLYLAEGGGFTFIARLARADASANARRLDPAPISANPVGHSARVSPGGEAALFTATAALSGYDNHDAASGQPDKEVFRYEAASGELSCVSCNPTGARPAGRHVTKDSGGYEKQNYWAAAEIPPAQHQLYFPRALSEDGKRLFFESYEPLLARDTNGKKDVYEWEAAGKGSCTVSAPAFSPANEGCLSLISSGQNGSDSSFLDASPDGSDVFFATAASLIGADPGLIDIYNARELGGFPEPTPPPPPCEGEACQSPPAAPEAPTPASSAYRGAGDLPASAGCRGAARRARALARRARALRRAARRTRAPGRSRALRRRAAGDAVRARRASKRARRCRARAERRARR